MTQIDKAPLHEGNLIQPSPYGDMYAVQIAVGNAVTVFSDAITRYRSNPSFENLVALSIESGNIVHRIRDLCVVFGIPLDRVLVRLETVQQSPKMIDKKHFIWDLLDQIRSEQEFEQKKNGGENWTASQAYKNFGKQKEI